MPVVPENPVGCGCSSDRATLVVHDRHIDGDEVVATMVRRYAELVAPYL